MVGRYVTIAIPTRVEYLSLCEVEVYGVSDVNQCRGNRNGTQTNVALKGIASPSSLGEWRGIPEHAIDGNKNSVYGSLSCTCTKYEIGPWWRVDLRQPYRISDVLITNREDCCWMCLKGAEIHIGNFLEKNDTLNHKF
nr:PREDICTED: fucolectin-1-like [Latimeria chalumnae]|eukprot:XP_014344322.1 PREDICTED: fucolectin-1-like [Latimeria chalumnae]